MLPDATEKLWLVGPKLPTWPVGSAHSWMSSCKTPNHCPPESRVYAKILEFHLQDVLTGRMAQLLALIIPWVPNGWTRVGRGVGQ